MGNSAGAMHVADYGFREELQHERDGVIGLVLISPPAVDLSGRELDPQRDALYYGPDGDRTDQSCSAKGRNHRRGAGNRRPDAPESAANSESIYCPEVDRSSVSRADVRWARQASSTMARLRPTRASM